jgi:hypothetical protein
VIQMNPAVLKDEKSFAKSLEVTEGKLCIYVASTDADPEVRFTQH